MAIADEAFQATVIKHNHGSKLGDAGISDMHIRDTLKTGTYLYRHQSDNAQRFDRQTFH